MVVPGGVTGLRDALQLFDACSLQGVRVIAQFGSAHHGIGVPRAA